MTLHRYTLFAIAGCVLAASGSVMAHHSTAGAFDMNQTVMLDGAISSIDWVNPHVLVYLEVKRSDGNPEIVALEGYSPNTLARAAGTPVELKDKLKPGVRVTVSAYPARAPYAATSGTGTRFSRMVEGGEIKLPDGIRIDFGSGPNLDSSSPRSRRAP